MAAADTPAWGTPPTEPVTQEFTVIGFYRVNEQRFSFAVTAKTAREAEDQVVKGGVADPAGQPAVAGVGVAQEGRVVMVDMYATYLNPDEKEAT